MPKHRAGEHRAEGPPVDHPWYLVNLDQMRVLLEAAKARNKEQGIDGLDTTDALIAARQAGAGVGEPV